MNPTQPRRNRHEEPPIDYRMDGYETYRKKHHDQIYRIMANPSKPTCEYESYMASGSFRRTKGNIAGVRGHSCIAHPSYTYS